MMDTSHQTTIFVVCKMTNSCWLVSCFNLLNPDMVYTHFTSSKNLLKYAVDCHNWKRKSENEQWSYFLGKHSRLALRHHHLLSRSHRLVISFAPFYRPTRIKANSKWPRQHGCKVGAVKVDDWLWRLVACVSHTAVLGRRVIALAPRIAPNYS